MSDSYLLHDIIRKVKADGLFDSIRRDLISDIEQKSSYVDLKVQIESLVSSYLSDYKWSSSLKKTDLREKARRHIETSNLIKETLPSLVNEYMQTCQEQSIQPRISSFVSDHLDRMYNTIGGSHMYHPTASFTQSISVQQEKPAPTTSVPPPSPTPVPVKKEPLPSKPNKNPPPTNVNKQKIVPKKKPIPPPTTTTPTHPIKEEKKARVLSPIHSPSDLVDISPSPPSVENEQTATTFTPSPPPPVVRVASPLRAAASKEIPKKVKRSSENPDEKKKKVKTEETTTSTAVAQQEKPEDVESDTRKLRSRRPNPKYSHEQYETEGLNSVEAALSSPPPPPSTTTKPKKSRHLKSSPSFDTPSSPPALIEPSQSVNEMSPEYGTSVPSPIIEKQPIENVDIQSRSPSPVTIDEKKSTSPRRLRPRRTHEKSTNADNHNEKNSSQKTRESSRHRSDQNDTNDSAETKQSRHPSSSNGDSNSLPDNTEDTQISPTPIPVSKSFIWKQAFVERLSVLFVRWFIEASRDKFLFITCCCTQNHDSITYR